MILEKDLADFFRYHERSHFENRDRGSRLPCKVSKLGILLQTRSSFGLYTSSELFFEGSSTSLKRDIILHGLPPLCRKLNVCSHR